MTRDRFQQIVKLSLPIIGGMTSQNLLNLVDAAMVGILGPAALAAIGFAGFLNFMAFAALTGMASAVQATASRRYGEAKHHETALPLNGGLLISLVIGLPLTIILFFYAPTIFQMLNHDADVIEQGVPYLQIRLLAIMAVGMNFSFRGYWNSVHHSTFYFKTLLIMHATNIILNYLLIFGKAGMPELGTTGAAIGTTASVYLGTLIYFTLGYRHARKSGFCQALPTFEQLFALLKLALPSSAQQFMFAAGMAAQFWIIGQVGTNEMAVTNALMNIVLVALLPAMGLGLTAASFVGHALGRKDLQDARIWPWDVAKAGSIIFITLGLPMVLFPELILSGFLHKPELIQLGKIPLQLVGATTIIDGIGMIMMQSLLGAGDSKVVMKISIGLQWFVFLPLAWIIGPYLGYGLLSIWCLLTAYRVLQTILFVSVWQSGKWTKITV